jgi:hypothetical protein
MGGVDGRDLRVLLVSPLVRVCATGHSPVCWGFFPHLEDLLHNRADLR